MTPARSSIEIRGPQLLDLHRDARADYNAARPSRYTRARTGVHPMGAGADWSLRSETDYYRMMEAARDADRNDLIVSQMVTRATDNIIQGGFRLDATTGDKKLDDALEIEWEKWATNPDRCDAAKERTFHEMESVVMRAQFVDGDHLVLPLRSGALQLIEGHRCRTPNRTKRNVVLGVLLDDRTREHIEYWIAPEDVDPRRPIRVSDVTRIPTRDSAGHRQVFHVRGTMRASQTRGVTAFAPIFDAVTMVEDINWANMVKQIVASAFGIIRTREYAPDRNYGKGAKKGEQTEEVMRNDKDGSRRIIEGIAPGMEYIGEPGEKLEAFAPNIPGDGYFEQIKLLIRLIGLNFGLPLVVALLDASETNFSGYRGAVDEARRGFMERQRGLISQFHSPAYRFRVRRAIAENPEIARMASAAGVDPFAHRWNPPGYPYIEPGKDAQADLLQIQNNLSSPRRVHERRGQNWYDIVEETIADNTHAIEKAMRAAKLLNDRLRADMGEDFTPVRWREILAIPMPSGMTVTANMADMGATETEREEQSAPRQEPSR